jgi:hypothetical protein
MRHDAYYITNDNSEDRLDSAETFQDAVRIAKSLAREGAAGDLIFIEHEGKNIWQLSLLPDGQMKEEVLA